MADSDLSTPPKSMRLRHPEKRNRADNPPRRKPPWIRTQLQARAEFGEVRRLMRAKRLNTVCEEARCPNIHECWGQQRTATFMVLGSVCTRRCRFCSVETGLPTELDLAEPDRVADAAADMGLRHVVVTMVTRDDLSDGGAEVIAATVAAIRARGDARIELLTSDFGGDQAALATVVASRPDILAHNAETVERLTPTVRSNSSYRRSLEFLRQAHGTRSTVTRIKSSLMVGLGESAPEVATTLEDLRSVGVEMVNIGQYLQPSRNQQAVARFWAPEEFARLRTLADELGFLHCEAGPFVRSSYHAEGQLAATGDRATS